MRVLAVDDAPGSLQYLQTVLEGEHTLTTCSSGSEGLEALNDETYDLAVLDLSMPHVDGFALLEAMRCHDSPPPVVVLSGADSARDVLRAFGLGASDYLLKPASPESIRAAVWRAGGPNAGAAMCEQADYGLLGQSAVIRRIHRLVPLVACSRDTVLITGPTGTGKEILARALHDQGPRCGGPFVVHNMAATPAELAESVFFGHTRGSFSGASSDHTGVFEQADRGTLFLDEVDSFPLPLQGKLLRVLENARVQPVGSVGETAVDVRIIASSAVDLEEMVRSGSFRADLFYRLKQLEVTLPPLAERRDDIPVLVRHFLTECDSNGGAQLRVSKAAMELLLAHPWPGNVRELRYAVHSAALLAGERPILPAHLPRAIARRERPRSSAEKPTTLAGVERQHILHVLRRARDNQSLAARLLGIDRGTLARKLRSFRSSRLDDQP